MKISTHDAWLQLKVHELSWEWWWHICIYTVKLKNLNGCVARFSVAINNSCVFKFYLLLIIMVQLFYIQKHCKFCSPCAFYLNEKNFLMIYCPFIVNLYDGVNTIFCQRLISAIFHIFFWHFFLCNKISIHVYFLKQHTFYFIASDVY